MEKVNKWLLVATCVWCALVAGVLLGMWLEPRMPLDTRCVPAPVVFKAPPKRCQEMAYQHEGARTTVNLNCDTATPDLEDF